MKVLFNAAQAELLLDLCTRSGSALLAAPWEPRAVLLRDLARASDRTHGWVEVDRVLVSPLAIEISRAEVHEERKSTEYDPGRHHLRQLRELRDARERIVNTAKAEDAESETA